MEPWIQTYSGIKFWPFDPKEEDVRFDDIAHALANIPRFGGHTRRFYSVAQHSLLVRELSAYDDGIAALLHDATEAYLGDVPSPLKRTVVYSTYRQAEKVLHGVIMRHFGLPSEIPASVKYGDQMALKLEAIWNMSPLHPDFVVDILPVTLLEWAEWRTPMSPDEAEERFRCTFESLWREFVALQPEYDREV